MPHTNWAVSIANRELAGMKCPHCKEDIKPSATRCAYCGGAIKFGDRSLRSVSALAMFTFLTFLSLSAASNAQDEDARRGSAGLCWLAGVVANDVTNSRGFDNLINAAGRYRSGNEVGFERAADNFSAALLSAENRRDLIMATMITCYQIFGLLPR